MKRSQNQKDKITKRKSRKSRKSSSKRINRVRRLSKEKSIKRSKNRNSRRNSNKKSRRVNRNNKKTRRRRRKSKSKSKKLIKGGSLMQEMFIEGMFKGIKEEGDFVRGMERLMGKSIGPITESAAAKHGIKTEDLTKAFKAMNLSTGPTTASSAATTASSASTTSPSAPTTTDSTTTTTAPSATTDAQDAGGSPLTANMESGLYAVVKRPPNVHYIGGAPGPIITDRTIPPNQYHQPIYVIKSTDNDIDIVLLESDQKITLTYPGYERTTPGQPATGYSFFGHRFLGSDAVAPRTTTVDPVPGLSSGSTVIRRRKITKAEFKARFFPDKEVHEVRFRRIQEPSFEEPDGVPGQGCTAKGLSFNTLCRLLMFVGKTLNEDTEKGGNNHYVRFAYPSTTGSEKLTRHMFFMTGDGIIKLSPNVTFTIKTCKISTPAPTVTALFESISGKLGPYPPFFSRDTSFNESNPANNESMLSYLEDFDSVNQGNMHFLVITAPASETIFEYADGRLRHNTEWFNRTIDQSCQPINLSRWRTAEEDGHNHIRIPLFHSAGSVTSFKDIFFVRKGNDISIHEGIHLHKESQKNLLKAFDSTEYDEAVFNIEKAMNEPAMGDPAGGPTQRDYDWTQGDGANAIADMTAIFNDVGDDAEGIGAVACINTGGTWNSASTGAGKTKENLDMITSGTFNAAQIGARITAAPVDANATSGEGPALFTEMLNKRTARETKPELKNLSANFNPKNWIKWLEAVRIELSDVDQNDNHLDTNIMCYPKWGEAQQDSMAQETTEQAMLGGLNATGHKAYLNKSGIMGFEKYCKECDSNTFQHCKLSPIFNRKDFIALSTMWIGPRTAGGPGQNAPNDLEGRTIRFGVNWWLKDELMQRRFETAGTVVGHAENDLLNPHWVRAACIGVFPGAGAAGIGNLPNGTAGAGPGNGHWAAVESGTPVVAEPGVVAMDNDRGGDNAASNENGVQHREIEALIEMFSIYGTIPDFNNEAKLAIKNKFTISTLPNVGLDEPVPLFATQNQNASNLVNAGRPASGGNPIWTTADTGNIGINHICGQNRLSAGGYPMYPGFGLCVPLAALKLT